MVPVSPVKTKGSSRSGKDAASGETAVQAPALTDAHQLLGRMLEYEEAARQAGVNAASGPFKMLSSSERQLHRAELIADYIRLAIGSLAATTDHYEAALASFCAKICETELPSLELLGTYLAAVDIGSQEDRLARMPSFDEAIKRTMITVLQTCVRMLQEKAPAAARR